MLLTQSIYEIDEAAMNVKSCLKANNGFLYRTVSPKLEEVKVIYYYEGRAARRGGCASDVARRLLRVRIVGVVP
jgi:hypothetical protein